jgi:hypothetical protein
MGIYSLIVLQFNAASVLTLPFYKYPNSFLVVTLLSLLILDTSNAIWGRLKV